MFRSWGCDVINMTTVPEVRRRTERGREMARVRGGREGLGGRRTIVELIFGGL